jgi:RNA polymerase sigma-70 factor (ECF subfamily)
VLGLPLDSERSNGPALEDAFIVERSRLLRYFERRAGQDAAPDLVQEVFLRAIGSGQARRLANPAAFLQRIARNLLIDIARKRIRDNVVVYPFEETRDIASPAEQEWGIEVADLLKLYEAAIDSLPDKTRRVFLMHRTDELSYRDIHRKLGISIATVEYHMIKALAHIARSVDAAR